MLAWLKDNLGTIVVSLILIAIVAAIVISKLRDHKNEKSTCGCDCAHCGSCHKH